MTSKRIAKTASILGRKSKSYVVREVAMSDLAQVKRARKKTCRTRKRTARRR